MQDLQAPIQARVPRSVKGGVAWVSSAVGVASVRFWFRSVGHRSPASKETPNVLPRPVMPPGSAPALFQTERDGRRVFAPPQTKARVRLVRGRVGRGDTRALPGPAARCFRDPTSVTRLPAQCARKRRRRCACSGMSAMGLQVRRQGRMPRVAPVELRHGEPLPVVRPGGYDGARRQSAGLRPARSPQRSGGLRRNGACNPDRHRSKPHDARTIATWPFPRPPHLLPAAPYRGGYGVR